MIMTVADEEIQRKSQDLLEQNIPKVFDTIIKPNLDIAVLLGELKAWNEINKRLSILKKEVEETWTIDLEKLFELSNTKVNVQLTALNIILK
jgi:hypothetical protein